MWATLWSLTVGLGMWSWPLACVVAGLQLGLIICSLIVETQRRRTLLALVERAPAGTMVVVGGTAELPAWQVLVGREPASRKPRP